jgi:hypothetical protein
MIGLAFMVDEAFSIKSRRRRRGRTQFISVDSTRCELRCTSSERTA